jgi:hypothetical protein
MDKKPWEVHPEFVEERLLFIAGILKDVRNRTVDLHEPSEGDDVWSLGCRVYERSINIITRKAEDTSWLKVIKKGLYFVMLIEGVPIRFYRGDIENPTARSLQRLHPEIEAQQYIFPFAQESFVWFWRIVVETDELGKVLRIVTSQFTESGDVRNQWIMSIYDTVTRIAPVVNIRRDSVVLEKPKVEPRQNTQERVAENDKGQ